MSSTSKNLIRTDDAFKRFLKDSAKNRIENRVDGKWRSSRELTKMLMNCPSFPNLKKELISIPKQEDLEKI